MFHLVLWQLSLAVVVEMSRYSTKYSNLHGSAVDNFSLKVKIKDDVKIINLTRTNAILANGHLPVWIASKKNNETLNKLNIMAKVGEFTLYHDYCTKTAVVYFHKWNRMNGVIDINYYINGLPFHKTDKVHTIGSKYIKSRGNEWYMTVSALSQLNNRTLKIPKKQDGQLTLYPELLVGISHKIHQAIEKNSTLPRNIKTILHVLTVYNAVDMMFRLVESVEIKLNIAAIVIEGTRNKWEFEKYHELKKPYINAEDINAKINWYFYQNRENYFPRHSYDFIVYHTQKWLHRPSARRLDGVSTLTTLDYSFPPYIPFFQRKNVAVKDDKTYKYYTAIVRELTYLITAKDDEKGPLSYLFDKPACEPTIESMRANSCLNSCLKWSHYAEGGFQDCLRKPAHCDLVNYPRSLYPRNTEPRITFSGDEQCRCYGFISHIQSQGSLPPHACNGSMYCRIDDPTKMAHVPWPVDGTPCGSNNVCWNYKCLPLD